MTALHSPNHAVIFQDGDYWVQHQPSMEKRKLAFFTSPQEPEPKWQSIWKATQDALIHERSASTASCTPHTPTSR